MLALRHVLVRPGALAIGVIPLTEVRKLSASRLESLLGTIGLVGVLLAASGCASASSTNAPAASSGGSQNASQAPAASVPAGNDGSTSKVTNVCKVLNPADANAAFGGTWTVDASYDNGKPLVCAFTDGPQAVSVELKPAQASSQGWYGDSVDGLGQKASIVANTLEIERGADVIEILWLTKMTPDSKAQLITFGKAIFPKF